MRCNIRHYSLIIFISLSLLAIFSVRANEKLPELGDPSQKAISLQQEKELGRSLLHYLRQNGLLNEDLEIHNYLNALTNQLIGWADTPYPLSFHIINDPSINAFAAPGGIIALHSGLILAAQTESELAAVIAHEISHISQRHAARNYASAQQLSLPTAAAILAAVLVGTQNPEAAQAAIIGIEAGAIQNQLNYSRQHEREADNVGIKILQKANIDASGMADFFLRLQQQARYAGEQLPAFLSTHPVTNERIANAQNRIQQKENNGRKDSLVFHLSQIKLLTTHSTNLQQTLSHLRKQQFANSYAQDAANYGQALILVRMGIYPEARQILSQLMRKHPDQSRFILALARLENEANQPQQALAYYQSAYQIFFNNPVLLLDYSALLLQQGQYQSAYILIKPLTQGTSLYQVQAWRLLAEILYMQDKAALAKESMAEHFVANGNHSAAIEQLKQALLSNKIHITDRERMTARLAELRRLHRS